MVEIYREQRVDRKEAPFKNVKRTASSFLNNNNNNNNKNNNNNNKIFI